MLRVPDREVAVEPRHLERAAGLEAGCGEHERAAIGELRAGLDEHAERGRVDEAHGLEVDDEALRRPLRGREERRPHRVGVVEVELAGEPHDEHRAVLHHLPDGRFVQPVGIVHRLVLAHAALTPGRSLGSSVVRARAPADDSTHGRFVP